MGITKDRNSKNITEADEIKKRLQKYTELYKKGLNDLDNCSGMLTNLNPDLQDCAVKLALGSTICLFILWTYLVDVMEFQLSYLKL